MLTAKTYKWWPQMAGVVIILAMLLALAAGFGTSARAQQSEPAAKPLPTLTVMVAAPLVPAIEAIAAELRAENLVDLQIESNSTEALLGELANNSRAADLVLIEGLEAAKLLVANKLATSEDFRTIASDRLVVCVRKADATDQPLDYLKSTVEPGRIVISNPETTMMGLHAKQAMKRLGIWKDISFKVRHADNGRAAADEVLQKTADAAVLYLSTVVQHAGLVATMTFPEHSYLPIIYLGAPVSGSQKAALAKQVLVRIAAPKSKDAWMAAGFNPPPASMP